MKASIVDLRYHMADVLKALERNEIVQVLYRGAVKAQMVPVTQKREALKSVSEHAFFSMNDENASVAQKMEDLRGGRF